MLDGPGACGPPFLVDNRCNLFHETNTPASYRALRPASCDRHHTCSVCVRFLLVSSPRTCLTFEDMPSVALVELHVGGPLRRCRSCKAQPREVLMTTAPFTHLQHTQPGGSPRSLFWPHMSVVSALRTARLLAREPPPYAHTTPFWSADGYS